MKNAKECGVIPVSATQAPDHQAGIALHHCYISLAQARQHLLEPILHGASPRQWAHYPEDDVIDHDSGYQYFYHSHSPDDRPDSPEHGHFHLFARLDGKRHAIDWNGEQAFLDHLDSSAPENKNTANLMCISLDAKGMPIALFTVNRWVTGDHLLSAQATLDLLKDFRIALSGQGQVNAWIAAMIGLYWTQIETLIANRDLHLTEQIRARQHRNILDENSIELLSSLEIDLDSRLAEL